MDEMIQRVLSKSKRKPKLPKPKRKKVVFAAKRRPELTFREPEEFKAIRDTYSKILSDKKIKVDRRTKAGKETIMNMTAEALGIEPAVVFKAIVQKVDTPITPRGRQLEREPRETVRKNLGFAEVELPEMLNTNEL